MIGEFGPWIAHDGTGRPVPSGTAVQVVLECESGDLVGPFDAFAGEGSGRSWHWANWRRVMPDGGICARVIRYRIRRPRGMEILQQLVENRRPVETSEREREVFGS